MSEERPGLLLRAMKDAGGVAAEYHGRTSIRHFGDPAREYEAASQHLAVFDRSHRARLFVSGRAPGQMLNGMLTGTLPTAAREVGEGAEGGTATYHAVLTQKGKMLTDLWALLPGEEDAPGYLLDVPTAGRDRLLELFSKALPPRFASVEDASDRTAMITAAGPEAASALADRALDDRVAAEALRALSEGEWRRAASSGDGLIVVRTEDVWPTAFSVVGDEGPVTELWSQLVRQGAKPAGLGVWSTLRVEAARPAFGTDMDEDTIPIEAGIESRAIDQTKGCYTGQEVIVRIRDRGHVNRLLTRLELGDVPTPAHGTELVAADGSGKIVGHITSAVQSPRTGGVLALAYVRRGVETVTLDGRDITVTP